MIDLIAAAFNAASASLAVEVSYGRGHDAAVIEQRLRDASVQKVNILVDVQQDQSEDVANASYGRIKSGTLMMYSFSRADKTAVDNLSAWWLTIAADSTYRLHDVSGKVTLGTVEFLRWRAVGGFQGFATKLGGNVWMCDQLVEYTARSLS